MIFKFVEKKKNSPFAFETEEANTCDQTRGSKHLQSIGLYNKLIHKERLENLSNRTKTAVRLFIFRKKHSCNFLIIKKEFLHWCFLGYFMKTATPFRECRSGSVKNWVIRKNYETFMSGSVERMNTKTNISSDSSYHEEFIKQVTQLQSRYNRKKEVFH